MRLRRASLIFCTHPQSGGGHTGCSIDQWPSSDGSVHLWDRMGSGFRRRDCLTFSKHHLILGSPRQPGTASPPQKTRRRKPPVAPLRCGHAGCQSLAPPTADPDGIQADGDSQNASQYRQASNHHKHNLSHVAQKSDLDSAFRHPNWQVPL